MKETLMEKIFKLKFLVGVSMVVSMLGMGTILAVGVKHMPKNEDTGVSSEIADLIAEAPQVVERVSGGDGGTPVIKLTVNPDKVVPGGSSVIAWEVTNADSCEASGAWSGPKNLVGNQDSGALNETATYTLTCTNASGQSTIDGTVLVDAAVALAIEAVNNATGGTSSSSVSSTSPSPSPSSSTPSPSPSTPSPSPSTPSPSPSTPSPSPSTPSSVAPSLTMTVNPSSISSGASSTISWSMNANASPTPSCTASGSWSGAKSPSGSASVSPTSNASYTLTCTNSAGSSAKTVSVTVSAPAPSCGSGGSCSSSQVAAHSSSGDCWVIVKYTASGGNGGNGQVYKMSSSFWGSSGHGSIGPSLSASSWCGKNISNSFNNKHSGGARSDGSNTAIWWLTNNGNSLIGPYSGS